MEEDKTPQVQVVGLDDRESDLHLLTQEIGKLLEPLKEDNDPDLMMWALQEYTTGYIVERHGTLVTLKILTNSINNVIDIGPFVELQLKGAH